MVYRPSDASAGEPNAEVAAAQPTRSRSPRAARRRDPGPARRALSEGSAQATLGLGPPAASGTAEEAGTRRRHLTGRGSNPQRVEYLGLKPPVDVDRPVPPAHSLELVRAWGLQRYRGRMLDDRETFRRDRIEKLPPVMIPPSFLYHWQSLKVRLVFPVRRGGRYRTTPDRIPD